MGIKKRQTYTTELYPQQHAWLKRRACQIRSQTGQHISIRNLNSEAIRVYQEQADAEGVTALAAGPDPRKLNMDWARDTEGKYTYLGPNWTRYTGRTLADGNPEEMVHPDDRDEAERIFQTALAARRAFYCEFRLLCARGGWVLVRSHGGPVWGPNRKFLGFSGSAFELQSHQPVLSSGHNSLLTGKLLDHRPI